MSLALRKATKTFPEFHVARAFMILSVGAGVELGKIAGFLHRNPIASAASQARWLRKGVIRPRLPDTESEAEALFMQTLGDREAQQLIRQIKTWGAQRRAVHAQMAEAA